MASIITTSNDEELFSPPSLLDICIHFCNSNPNILEPVRPSKNPLLSIFSSDKSLKVQRLPSKVWEELFDDHECGISSEDYLPLLTAVIKSFSHTSKNLTRLNLSNCEKLSDDGFRLIMSCSPVTLDIHNCPALTKKSVDIINEFGENLMDLCIGNSNHVIPSDVKSWISKHPKHKPQGLRKVAKSITKLFTGPSPKEKDDKAHGLFITPNLRKLVIWGLHITQMQPAETGETEPGTSTLNFWEYVTRDFIHKLEYLDLSCCQEIIDLNFLLEAKYTLKSLLLHDVLLDYDEKTWGVVKNLTQLRFLDVSQYNELASVFANPDSILHGIVTSLPNLVGLDISGTNLAGFEPSRPIPPGGGIPGLRSRKGNPLNFLGLLTTHYNASSRNNIPAKQIAGGRSMTHLLVALQHYLRRPNIVKKVIRMLHEKIQVENRDEFVPCHSLLRSLLQVLNCHMDDKHTQIVTLASLFYVIKKIFNGDNNKLGKYRCNLMIKSITKTMQVHNQDMSLLRNGILNLLVIVHHIDENAYVDLLVPTLILAGNTCAACQESFLLEGTGFLLCFILKPVDKVVKEKVGGRSEGIIKGLCDIIEVICNKNMIDEVSVSMFWTALWTLTDEVKRNCERFVEAGGVELTFRFIKLIQERLSENPGNDLAQTLAKALIPMLALLSNILWESISEDKVVTQENISVLVDTANNIPEQNQEILIHVCGVLCYMASKQCSHTLLSPSRSEVLQMVFQKISAVDFLRSFSYDFRCLKPLYHLLKVEDAPEIHVWILWILVNLTKTNAIKYGKMILDDGLNVTELHQRFSCQNGDACKEERSRLCGILLETVNTVAQQFRLEPNALFFNAMNLR